MGDAVNLCYVKKVIHSLILSTPKHVTVEQLRRDFLTEEGSHIPFTKFGFKDLESFLRSIPDTVVVSGYGPMAYVFAKMIDKSAHIQQLVQAQKKPPKSRRKVSYRQVSNIVFINENYHQFQCNSNSSSNRFHTNTSNHIGNQLRPPQTTFPVRQVQNQRQDHETLGLARSFEKCSLENVVKRDIPVVNKATDNNVLPAHSELIREQREVPQTDLEQSILLSSDEEGGEEDAIPAYVVDERESNCKSKVNEMDRIINVEKPKLPKVQGPNQDLSEEKRISSVDEHLKNSNLDMTKIEQPVVILSSEDDGSDSEAIPTYAVSELVLSVDYPKDAVHFNQQLPKRDMKSTFKLEDRIQVQVVTVYSPHEFYFWLYNDELDNYKAMSSNMQNYYRKLADRQYRMPLFFIMPGHLAAYRMQGSRWHRVQVLNIKTGYKKNIEVELVDTGERIWVSHTELKYLCKEFATLPAQCWAGRLSYIVARQGIHFSAQACDYFFKQVSYRRLYAKVNKLNEELNAVHMVLVNPDAEQKTQNINMKFLETGWVRRSYKI